MFASKQNILNRKKKFYFITIDISLESFHFVLNKMHFISNIRVSITWCVWVCMHVFAMNDEVAKCVYIIFLLLL